MTGLGRRIQREPGNLSPERVQPQAQPAALESGVAGYQHPTSTVGVSEACQFQHFHGALPLLQSSSSRFLSRSVSIGCQKPECSNAIN